MVGDSSLMVGALVKGVTKLALEKVRWLTLALTMPNSAVYGAKVNGNNGAVNGWDRHISWASRGRRL